MSLLSKEMDRVNATLIKVSMAFFIELEKTILKYMKNQKSPNSQSHIEQKEQSRLHYAT
jgi:hypothetical protein